MGMTMGDVVDFSGDVHSKKNGDDIVKALEHFLELARNGELKSLAGVTITTDGYIERFYVYGGQSVRLLGAVAILQKSILDNHFDNG